MGYQGESRYYLKVHPQPTHHSGLSVDDVLVHSRPFVGFIHFQGFPLVLGCAYNGWTCSKTSYASRWEILHLCRGSCPYERSRSSNFNYTQIFMLTKNLQRSDFGNSGPTMFCYLFVCFKNWCLCLKFQMVKNFSKLLRGIMLFQIFILFFKSFKSQV